jgi:hypothetical protein
VYGLYGPEPAGAARVGLGEGGQVVRAGQRRRRGPHRRHVETARAGRDVVYEAREEGVEHRARVYLRAGGPVGGRAVCRP